MTTNLPYGEPATIHNNSQLLGQMIRKELTATDVRNNAELLEELHSGNVSKEFLKGVRGLPFYYGMVAPTEESTAIGFERNFNPLLKRDTDYFKAMGKVITCVEKH